MITRIWLVRHGQIAHNRGVEAFTGWNGASLTDDGVRQANLVSRRLSHEPLEHVFSSSLARAQQTAEIIAVPHSLDVTPLHGLNEVNYGEWDGLTRQQARSASPDVYSAWVADAEHVRIPGGETFAETAERSWQALLQVADMAAGGACAAVSHKSTIRILLCLVMGLPVSQYRQIGQSNCALNLLIRDGSRWVVRLVNDETHLTVSMA